MSQFECLVPTDAVEKLADELGGPFYLSFEGLPVFVSVV
jgi:hypothetical protein